MANLMYGQMGLSAIQSVTDFAISKETAKLDRAVQAYTNTMSALSAANANNTTTLNEVQSLDASLRQGLDIQRAQITATGAAKAAAGAAGVAGGSVDSVMRGLRSSAARAQYARTTQTKMQMRAFGQERRNTAVNQAMNKDITVIPKPSATSAALGLGMNMLEIWDNHQTPSDTIAERLGRQGE